MAATARRSESVMASIEAMRESVSDGMSRQELLTAMPAGAARNAIDCALWDIEAKLGQLDNARELGAGKPRALETAYTISLGEPDAMAAQGAERHAARPLLKVKVGTADDTSRIEGRCQRPRRTAASSSTPMRAGRKPTSATTCWSRLACRIALIEQPLPFWPARTRSLPISRTRGRSAPMKACTARLIWTSCSASTMPSTSSSTRPAGLTDAIRLHARARELGFGIMVGSMVGTSLAMAPALWLAQDAGVRRSRRSASSGKGP